MAWLSFLRRKPATEAAAAAASRPGSRRREAVTDDAEVDQARARARRRLIGATVLLGVGVIAFPLLFETEPRPIAVDLPIEIPRRDALPPPALPDAPAPGAAGAEAPTASAPSAAAVGSAPSEAPAAPDSPGAHDAPDAPDARATPAAPSMPAAGAAASASASPEAAAASPAPAPRPPPAADDGARARALLEGRTGTAQARPAAPERVAAAAAATPAGKPDPAPEATPRYVVQVGAYADPGAVRAVRGRVEQLGLRSYTQVVKVDAGERTRVRIGPFDDRTEADKVAGRLRAAGLPSAVLRL